jgi:glycosyltransferase involved in cell wall biosynthesis
LVAFYFPPKALQGLIAMSSPLVTIITPTYNRADYLAETIESVLTQDYPDLEYIVLDDGSKDNTKEILAHYSSRIIWDSHPNMGEASTVNKGFGMAKGEIVCVVNSDDPLLPGVIKTAVKTLQEHPDALAVYPDWNEIGPHSEFIRRRQLPDYDILNMLTDFNVAMGPGVFIRRSAIERFGMRDARLKYVGDLEFWFRLASHGKLIHIPAALATHRVHPQALSVTDRGSQMADELIQIIQRIYAQPDIPEQLQRVRDYVFGQAHCTAAHYCGNDRQALRCHMLLSFQFDPSSSPSFIISYGKMFWKFLKARFSVLQRSPRSTT